VNHLSVISWWSYSHTSAIRLCSHYRLEGSVFRLRQRLAFSRTFCATSLILSIYISTIISLMIISTTMLSYYVSALLEDDERPSAVITTPSNCLSDPAYYDGKGELSTELVKRPKQ
jgi:hypothetical protein